MSEQEIWKSWKGEQWCFWSNVPFDVKPKLADRDGMPVEGKTCDYQGNHYEVKKVPGKDGKQAWYKVVKTPLGAATTNWDEVERKRQERDAGFEQRHRESMDAMSMLIAAITASTTAAINLNETCCALLEEMRRGTRT